MTRVDVLLAAVLLLFALRGLWRGFLREIFGLAGLLAGAVAAATWSTPLGDQLAARLHIAPALGDLITGAALVVLVVLAASLAGRLARRVARAIWLGPVDRGLGAVFGFAKGAALVGLGLMALQRLAPGSSTARIAAESELAHPLVDLADRLVESVRPYAPPAVRRAA
jgi:membrane protein required for colicin V production